MELRRTCPSPVNNGCAGWFPLEPCFFSQLLWTLRVERVIVHRYNIRRYIRLSINVIISGEIYQDSLKPATPTCVCMGRLIIWNTLEVLRITEISKRFWMEQLRNFSVEQTVMAVCRAGVFPWSVIDYSAQAHQCREPNRWSRLFSTESPLKLKCLCRVALRKWMHNIHGHYFEERIPEMNIPPAMLNFILYRDMWDIDSALF